MLGASIDFADSVATVQDWIANNGGWEENLLIVTADHDHCFTLNTDDNPSDPNSQSIGIGDLSWSSSS